VDIETRWSASIDCIGFAYESVSGICVPFSTLGSASFWSEDEELVIYRLMTQALSNKNCKVVAQNGSYDAAFLYKYWLVGLPIAFDTMIAHHVLYNNMQKDLAFLASIYCETFKYWKSDQQHGGSL
jgi:DNA polymerase I-like protein with 3'-5' exonuclease and polymerase domains